jgi:hypothetical protein
MKLRKIALHIIIFIAALVVISAVAIWFGLGPVVHSETVSRLGSSGRRSGGAQSTSSDAGIAARR